MKRVAVLLPLPVDKPFDYLVPDGIAINNGDWVEVPFGPHTQRGVVWQVYQAGEGDLTLDAAKLKPVLNRIESPSLGHETRRFVDWVANYTLFPPGTILRMVMRTGSALTPPKGINAVCLSQSPPETGRITPQRQKVLDICTHAIEPVTSLAERAGVSTAIIRGLVKSEFLEADLIDPDMPFGAPDLNKPGKNLSPDQKRAAVDIHQRINTGNYKPILLDGVTGSGKTEVYLEAVKSALEQDPAAQILVMLPEIGLTKPFLTRIEKRFGCKPAEWHSDVSMAERRRVWRRVLDGQARLVVGARSALFLPFQHLRLVIVDEEHDGAYKQEDGVLYQGRDMAVARGSLDKFPVILASATPALETIINASDGRYDKLTLPSRFGTAQLPDIDLIDMRENKPQPIDGREKTTGPHWISPRLCEAINDTLVRGEQSLLFLNRRGYAPLTICRQCGHKMTAPDSDTCLVEHRFENRLMCHHTGYSIAKPTACPHCHAVGGLSACGPGVERIADEARRRWPHARMEILSSDRSIASKTGDTKSLLEQMAAGEIDILVATQAAAKGHNFPNLTLVGVIDADMGLAGGDLRAAERTYQLLAQVAGRAGRAEKPGRALLQTYQPNAPVLNALIDGNRDQFLAIEAEGRIAMLFPPFGRLAAIILRGKVEAQVRAAANALKHSAPRADGIEIWGPAPAPIFRLNGEVRMRMLVRTRRDLNLQAYLRDWQKTVKIPGGVRRVIDIDPYSFM